MATSDSRRKRPLHDDVRRGREAYAARAWNDAYLALSSAEAEGPLQAEDLERLAWSAALSGRDEAMIAVLERLHAAWLEEGDREAAARAAFWAGFRLLSLGEVGRAGGWLARAERLLPEGERPLRGWLLIPEVYRHLRGDLDRAFELAGRAAVLGERHHDRDLMVFARTQQGAARLRQGRVREGLALLDEAMLTATTTELNPVVTGLVYCTMIAGCSRVWALERAREWTGVLSRWCESQPQLVTFAGTCLVHRAEMLQLDGSWHESMAEARRVSPGDPAAVAAGLYQEAEIHRLLGEHALAEEGYQAAGKAGLDPQPGLSLLRLAQGRTDAALKALDRSLQATTEPLQRARLLPAQVEILLAAGLKDRADAAATELRAIAAATDAPVLSAIADQVTGAVLLAGGRPGEALPLLRRSLSVWQELPAPYLAARVRVLCGKACRALGDEEGARVELDTARTCFEKLGAVTDLKQLAGPAREGRLTARELQVLRLVAAGRTNAAIARELSLSEKTVDRHLSNIFGKLDVSSRAAATAHALRHDLL